MQHAREKKGYLSNRKALSIARDVPSLGRTSPAAPCSLTSIPDSSINIARREGVYCGAMKRERGVDLYLRENVTIFVWGSIGGPYNGAAFFSTVSSVR